MDNTATGAQVSPAGLSFEPDILAGHCYFKIFRPKAHFSPEERLMFAVLTDAVECFQKHANAKTRSGRNLFKEAEAWFGSRESLRPFSFEYVCEVFDLNPNYIRIGLTGWRHTHGSRKGRHKRMRVSLRYQNRVRHDRLYIPTRKTSALAL